MRGSTKVNASLVCKYQARVEVNNLLRYEINYDCKIILVCTRDVKTFCPKTLNYRETKISKKQLKLSARPHFKQHRSF